MSTHAVQPQPSAGVTAQIRYASETPVALQPDRPFADQDDNAETATVFVHDARKIAPSLDREGFVIARQATRMTDPRDPAQIDGVWRPEVEALLKRVTGASQVITWASNVRHAAAGPDLGEGIASRPARRVHSDFGPGDFGAAIRHPIAREIEAEVGDYRARRWRCFNVWQPLSAPPQDTPLMLCDARSVSPEDIVIDHLPIEVAGQPRFDLELCGFRCNPAHRWFYVPDMRRDEVLIFSGIDPKAPGLRIVPHTAFDDPTCPAGTPPRSSIEVRAFAVFDA